MKPSMRCERRRGVELLLWPALALLLAEAGSGAAVIGSGAVAGSNAAERRVGEGLWVAAALARLDAQQPSSDREAATPAAAAATPEPDRSAAPQHPCDRRAPTADGPSR